MLTTWNAETPFNSVLFDAKFVELVLVQIIGKEKLIGDNHLKKEMRFIQGVYFMNNIIIPYSYDFLCILFFELKMFSSYELAIMFRERFDFGIMYNKKENLSKTRVEINERFFD